MLGMQGSFSHSLLLSKTLKTDDVVWLLSNFSDYYRQPFSAELLLQQFTPPFLVSDLIEACKALGLQVGSVPWHNGQLAQPAIAFQRDEPQQNAEEGGQALPVIITELTESGAKGISVGANQPVNFTSAALRQDFLDVLLLVQKKEAGLEESPAADSVTAEPKKFGFSWFVPELLRHKKSGAMCCWPAWPFRLLGFPHPCLPRSLLIRSLRTTQKARSWCWGQRLWSSCCSPAP